MANNYIDNKEFLKHIKRYKRNKKAGISDYLGKCFLDIATHLSYKPNFINYTYKEEMISDGIENCLMYINNFDPKKSNNPFAYFTQIIYYAFLRRIQKEKKQTYIKHKSIEHEGIFEEEMDGFSSHTKEYLEYAREEIHTFEEKIKEKKRVKPVKKKSLENFMEK